MFILFFIFFYSFIHTSNVGLAEAVYLLKYLRLSSCHFEIFLKSIYGLGQPYSNDIKELGLITAVLTTLEMTTVKGITSKLVELEIEFTVDDTTPTLSIVLDRFSKGDRLVVLTSPSAIMDYDSFHPERIECILIMSRTFYRVFVNNREMPTDSTQLRFWTSSEPLLEAPTCSICLNHKKGNVLCSSCHAACCKTCFSKISGRNVFKCPTCRKWNLFGHEFGTPVEELMMQLEEEEDPIELLVSLVKKLDGRVSVMLRIDGKFSAPFEMTILTRTRRYAPGSRRVKALRAMLRLERDSTETADFLVYISRDTYAVEENPVLEMSVLRLSSRLYQYSVDAWVNVLDVPSDRSLKKVAYSHCHDFRTDVPSTFFDMYNRVRDTMSAASESTCSISTRYTSMNFDVSNGRPTTMHVDMIAARLCILIETKSAIFVIWRMHGPPSRVIAFSSRGHGEELRELSREESRRLLKRNVDGIQYNSP